MADNSTYPLQPAQSDDSWVGPLTQAAGQMLNKKSAGYPLAAPSPYDQAVSDATQRYPWLRTLGVPIKLTTGSGPYMSESYGPTDKDNPAPGSFTVQLRDPKIINSPKQWSSLLAREGIDYVARHDPIYQKAADQFLSSMTPEQLKRSRERYESDPDEKKNASFEDFMHEAELQEIIGGYVTGESGWKDYPYTPQQRQMLDQLKGHLWQGQTPQAVDLQ